MEVTIMAVSDLEDGGGWSQLLRQQKSVVYVHDYSMYRLSSTGYVIYLKNTNVLPKELQEKIYS